MNLKNKVVITGINGFVGKHLARELNSAGIGVIGVGTDATVADEIASVVDEYFEADLTQTWPAIPDVDAVIHLAGLAAVGPSFDDPQKYINLNSAMVTNLCEYYLNTEKKPRIVLISSGAIYDSNQTMPITERGALGLTSPYAVSKVLNENQATYYRNRGLDCIVMRPFNHIGPGQAPGFILPDFYQRLSELKDKSASIRVGNISTKRDYTDVRDIVKAYHMVAVATSLKHTVYNVCSGKSTSGLELLTELKNGLGMPNVTFEIDQSLVRPTDIMDISGDSSQLKDELGWEPRIPLLKTITDFIGVAKP